MGYSMKPYIITGASSNHFKSLCQFLNTVVQYASDCHLIVYDLDLTKNECDFIQEILKKIPSYSFEKFNYSKYPEYFNIHVEAGQYAWKPAILNEVLQNYPHSLMLWCDAGNKLTSSLQPVWDTIEKNYIYSTKTTGNVPFLMHSKTLEYFKLLDEPRITSWENQNGAIIGLNATQEIVRDFIKDLYDGACTLECIAPPGSNRENHRQDQSVLTLLFHLFFEKNPSLSKNLFEPPITIHNDID